MLILSLIRTLVCPDCRMPFETRARTVDDKPIRCPTCRRLHKNEASRKWNKEHKAKK